MSLFPLVSLLALLGSFYSGSDTIQEAGASAAVIRALAGSDDPDERAALSRIRQDTALRTDPAVRKALRDALARAIERDRLEARTEVQRRLGVRASTPWRERFQAIVSTAIAVKDPDALPLLAQVDSDQVLDPLITVGLASLDPIVNSLRAPPAPGQSHDFKARLIRPLIVLSRFPLDFRRRAEQQVTEIARERLSKSDNAPELLALLRLADAIDDAEVLRQVTALATSETAFTSRGITDGNAVATIRKEANRVLARRVTLP